VGKFIISLDCEGRWGGADRETPLDASITGQTLRPIYQRLFESLDSAGLRATFATVGAFVLPEEILRSHRLLRDPPSAQHARWTKRLRKALPRSTADAGWTFSELADEVNTRGHELASHGFSHLPFSKASMPTEALSAELDMHQEWTRSVNSTVSSLVFPRNSICWLSELHDIGIRCYRDRPERVGSRITLREVLTEVSPWGSPEPMGTLTANGMIRLPPGRFFNRRSGPRALVPPAVTVHSWKTALQRAAQDPQATVHLWLHPHNLLENQTQFDLLDIVFNNAGELVRSDDLQSATMAELASLTTR